MKRFFGTWTLFSILLFLFSPFLTGFFYHSKGVWPFVLLLLVLALLPTILVSRSIGQSNLIAKLEARIKQLEENQTPACESNEESF